jgi:hypothetical protein
MRCRLTLAVVAAFVGGSSIAAHAQAPVAVTRGGAVAGSGSRTGGGGAAAGHSAGTGGIASGVGTGGILGTTRAGTGGLKDNATGGSSTGGIND